MSVSPREWGDGDLCCFCTPFKDANSHRAPQHDTDSRTAVHSSGEISLLICLQVFMDCCKWCWSGILSIPDIMEIPPSPWIHKKEMLLFCWQFRLPLPVFWRFSADFPIFPICKRQAATRGHLLITGTNILETDRGLLPYFNIFMTRLLLLHAS